MRWSIVSVFFAVNCANADLGRFNEHRELEAKDVGAYHTDAFEKLGKIYKENKPKRKLDAMMDLSNIMSGYCDVEDSLCKSQAHKSTLTQFHAIQHGMPETDYPEDIDPAAKEAMEQALSLIYGLDEHNVDDIVDALTQVQSDLESMKDDKGHLMGAIASLSVAIESTKLWHNVFTDPEHDLHETVTFGKRRLQLELPDFDIPEIIEADVTAAISSVVSTDPVNFFTITGPPKIFTAMILDSIAASAAMALNTTESEFLFP